MLSGVSTEYKGNISCTCQVILRIARNIIHSYIAHNGTILPMLSLHSGEKERIEFAKKVYYKDYLAYKSAIPLVIVGLK